MTAKRKNRGFTLIELRDPRGNAPAGAELGS